MLMLEYENLVASEENALQEKVSAAMDEAFHMMEIMQSKLKAEIKADPRKSKIINKKIGFTVSESNSRKWEKELVKVAIELGVRSLTESSKCSEAFGELVAFNRSLNAMLEKRRKSSRLLQKARRQMIERENNALNNAIKDS